MLINRLLPLLCLTALATLALSDQKDRSFLSSWATPHLFEMVCDMDSDTFFNLLYTNIPDYPWQLELSDVSEIVFFPGVTEIEWLALLFEREDGLETANRSSPWWEVGTGGECVEKNNFLVCKLNPGEKFRLFTDRKLNMKDGFDIVDRTLVPKLITDVADERRFSPLDSSYSDSGDPRKKYDKLDASLVQVRVLPAPINAKSRQEKNAISLLKDEANDIGFMLFGETLINTPWSIPDLFDESGGQNIIDMQRHVSIFMYRQGMGVSGASGGDDPNQRNHFFRTQQEGLVPTGQQQFYIKKPRSTEPLVRWISEHQSDPYPAKEEKQILANHSGMNLTQLSTWFANARRRIKKIGLQSWLKAWSVFVPILPSVSSAPPPPPPPPPLHHHAMPLWSSSAPPLHAMPLGSLAPPPPYDYHPHHHAMPLLQGSQMIQAVQPPTLPNSPATDSYSQANGYEGQPKK